MATLSNTGRVWRGGIVTRVLIALLASLVLASMLVPSMASPAQAQAVGNRSIEVFYERDLVLIQGYDPGATVKIEVLRGAENTVVGSVTGTTAPDGSLEINHTGDNDCWDLPFTPDIQPGDTVKTTVLDANGDPALNANGDPDTNSTVVRDIAIDFNIQTELDMANVENDDFSGTITVTGHARSTDTAPIGPDDVLEIRLNKNNRDNPWGDGPRKDLRAQVVAADFEADNDGDPTTFKHVFPDVTEEDILDVQQNGVAAGFEWSPPVDEPNAPPEITVFDESEGVPPGCPPHENTGNNPVNEPVPNVNQALSGNLPAQEVNEGRTIEVVHGIEFVLLNNFPANREVRVDVVRKNPTNGQNVVIGSTTQKTDSTGLMEINHLGEGPFPDGDCWDYPGTPDIKPGDTVLATVLGPDGKPATDANGAPDVDSTVVRDVFLNTDQPVIEDLEGANSKLIVTGHARSTAEAPINAGDVIEIRLNKNNKDDRWDVGTGTSVERPDRKDLRGNVAEPGDFTHEFIVTDADAADVAANGVEMGVEWSPAVADEAIEPGEITVFNGTDLEGVGCPQRFGAQANEITGSSHKYINQANETDQQITLSGISYGMEQVLVKAGGAQTTVTPVAIDQQNAPNGAQTWEATLDVNLAELPDGPFEASATFLVSDLLNNGQMVMQDSDIAEMLVDTAAPDAPTATPAPVPGGFTRAQLVTLSGDGSIYYTDNSNDASQAAADPKTDGILYGTALEVNASQTIRAIAVDRAGNMSNEASFDYVILRQGEPAPTITPRTPAPDSTIQNRRPNITATVRDQAPDGTQQTNLRATQIRLWVNGERQTNFSYNRATDLLSYTPRRNLPRGLAEVRIVATDDHGNRASHSWTFIVRRV